MPRNPSINEFYILKDVHATDFRAPKLGKSSPGDSLFNIVHVCGLSKQTHGSSQVSLPTNNYPSLEPYNPSIDIPELHKVCRSMDFEAPKLC